MRIERIVIGVDFSPPSHAAIDWVARNFPDATLVLVHCVELPRLPDFLGAPARARERALAHAHEGARERLDIVGRALDAGPVRTEVRECTPVDGLVAAAVSHGADLVVVATTGERLGGLWRGRVGRTAERLARRAPVPVLLCAGLRRERPRAILAALDDAPVTPHVLAWTRALATRFDARVTALHVVSSRVYTHALVAAGEANGARDAEWTGDSLRGGAERWIGAMVAAGLEPGRATGEVDFGEPGHEIVAAAIRHESDLVVLGSSGEARVRRALLGSVVSDVLHWAPCPVLVVVEPAREPGAPDR